MQETHVRFPSGDVELEGLMGIGDGPAGVVIAHPHPLYGGDMTNPVVEAIAAAYGRCGMTTLRFNFRGTGSSSGSHDRGGGERTDVVSAVAFLQRRGMRQIHLSGYSFGAWVNAMALQEGLAVQTTTMVAPPVAFIAFDPSLRLPSLTGVVAGSRDEFAPPALIRPLIGQWNPRARLEILQGADHFFFGFLDQVTGLLARWARPPA